MLKVEFHRVLTSLGSSVSGAFSDTHNDHHAGSSFVVELTILNTNVRIYSRVVSRSA